MNLCLIKLRKSMILNWFGEMSLQCLVKNFNFGNLLILNLIKINSHMHASFTKKFYQKSNKLYCKKWNPSPNYTLLLNKNLSSFFSKTITLNCPDKYWTLCLEVGLESLFLEKIKRIWKILLFKVFKTWMEKFISSGIKSALWEYSGLNMHKSMIK